MIKLHSEYQNDSGAPKTDVMGIMAAWYVPPSPGYPRPKGATPDAGVAGARLQRSARRRNRTHGPPDSPARPDPSCNPPALSSSGQLTVGTPDANGAPANWMGFVKIDVVVGNAGHPRRRGRRALHGVDDGRAPQHDRAPRLHGPAAAGDDASG